ncbi:hypothetical protein EG68_12067, partial [Paragonimus skrjabini miyazakii]
VSRLNVHLRLLTWNGRRSGETGTHLFDTSINFEIGKQDSTTLSDRSTTSSSRDQVDATGEVNTNNNGHGGPHAHVDPPRSTAVVCRTVSKPVSDWVCDQARTQPNAPNTALSSMLSSLSSELAQQGAITASKGFCYACKKPIVGMLISAMDKEWHPDHFTCVGCGICLVREDFYERDNQPYCLDCHAKLFSPRCGYCGEAILERISTVSSIGDTARRTFYTQKYQHTTFSRI